jgi:hypothetical protein
VNVPLLRIDEWIVAQLGADGDLVDEVGQRIYGDKAPEDAAFPFVLFQAQSPARDVRGIGLGTPARIMVNAIYLVRAVGRAEDYGPLRPAADRIDEVLEAASGNVFSGTVVHCVRQEEFRLTETLAGAQVRHLGAMFRIWAS